MSKSAKISILVFIILILDQALKIWVKTHMEYGDDIRILGQPWARLHFVENPGMAFGMEIAGDYGKLILSLFRLGAVGFLIYLIRSLIKSAAGMGLLFSFGLVLAGALGNIIDSVFYGVIFSASPIHGGLAMMFPPDGGYAPLLYGKVVDMFYFPMFRGYFPDWFPFWAGERFTFFKPVFNIADSAITVGVFSLILFHRSFFSGKRIEEEVSAEESINPIESDPVLDKDSNSSKENTSSEIKLEDSEGKDP
ncbi:MAG: lipoprotein signal peptidase [Saprospiraceae bacterium]|nr:lipoprotein signal peptidase [Saprospiraceae bacterium]